MLTIGSHLSSAKGYLHMAKDAVEIGANTFQFFTRNPRGGRAKAIDPEDVVSYKSYADSHGIRHILAHASYTINPASDVQKTHDFAVMILAEDLARMEETPHQMYNLHPGSALKQEVEQAIAKTAGVLNEVMLPVQTSRVLLETMAGKGSQIGGSFEELAAIIEQINLKNQVGVCLDTCHVWDAGYDIVNNLEGVLDEFDHIIGLDRLFAIHLNDSMNPRGSRKDRHACIGEGEIGFEAISAITNHPRLCNLPFYLETPNDLFGHKKEIAELRRAYKGCS